jgi:hypothetical protein
VAGVDPMARYFVLVVLGITGWNYARAQPTSSPFRQTVDQIRGFFKPHPSVAGGGPAPSPAPAAAPSPAPSAPAAPSPAAPSPTRPSMADWGPIPQLHDDGKWWLDQSRGGRVSSQLIDPQQYAQYGIAPTFPPPGMGDRVPLVLHDSGGFPLVFDPSSGAIEQDPTQGGTNTYGRGDVFVDARDGSTWTWFPTSQLLQSADASLLVTVAQFSGLT